MEQSPSDLTGDFVGIPGSTKNNLKNLKGFPQPEFFFGHLHQKSSTDHSTIAAGKATQLTNYVRPIGDLS